MNNTSIEPVTNSIDNLIDQIDQIDQNDQNNTINLCIKCMTVPNNLFKLSCNHLICIGCIENLIDNDNYKNCPGCNVVLTKNLYKVYSKFLADPIAKLEYYHNIKLGDNLWWYGGNDHNWLYSKNQTDHISNAYNSYINEDDDDDDHEIELQIQVGQTLQTYIIDFENEIQYQKSMPSKKRPIGIFKFKSFSDLKKNKIIGIAGKLL